MASFNDGLPDESPVYNPMPDIERAAITSLLILAAAYSLLYYLIARSEK